MKNKKLPLIVIAILITLTGAVFAYRQFFKDNTATASVNRGINSVNYGAPTEDEKKAGDTQKEANVKRDNLNDTKVPDTQTAELTVVDSSQYGDMFEIRAFVSNVFEEGGTCTATFTKDGGTTVTQSTTATMSAKTTQCRTLQIPISSFTSKGDWQLVISYTSAKASGSVTPKTVTIK